MSYSPDVLKLNPELAEMEAKNTEKPSKYKNVRADAQGMTFQSGHEAAIINNLILLEQQKQIFALRLQVRFPLQGGVIYTADAVYIDDKLGVHVIDCKAFDRKSGKYLRTKDYSLKRKLFKEKYNKEIEEV